MPTAIEGIETPVKQDQTAVMFGNLAESAAESRHTILGICPHCSGNVVRVTTPPNAEHHAKCLQCARDICCPAINLPAAPKPPIGSNSRPARQTSPVGRMQR